MEFTVDDLDDMEYHLEKILKHGGRLMTCVEKMREEAESRKSSPLKKNEDEDDEDREDEREDKTRKSRSRYM